MSASVARFELQCAVVADTLATISLHSKWLVFLLTPTLGHPLELA
jgi:hypothetical protein